MLATILLAGGVYFLHYTHGRVLAEVLLIVGFSTAISFGMRVPFGTLNAGQHFDITAWVLILTGALRAIGTVLVLDAGFGVVSLAWLAVFTAIPANAIILWTVHHKYPFLKIFPGPVGIDKLRKNFSTSVAPYSLDKLPTAFAFRPTP